MLDLAKGLAGVLDSHAELVPTPPTTVADRDIVVHGSVRRIKLRLMGEGHTTSDVVVYLPDERIAFPGDLVFVGRQPYLPDGMPDGWRSALRTLQHWQPARVVPGHGPVSGADSITGMLGYLDALEGLARTGHRQGQSPEAVAATPVPPAYADWFFRMSYAANLEFLASRVKAP